jgi:hypothetical protein
MSQKQIANPAKTFMAAHEGDKSGLVLYAI